MADENKDCNCQRRREPPAIFSEARAWALSASRPQAPRRSLISISSLMCCTSPRRRQCGQARPLSAGLRDARCELRHLHHSLAGGLFLAQRRMHASWLPDSVEAGVEHDCLPLPRQQICFFERANFKPGDKIEGPAPKPLPWKRIWLNDDGDLLVDRSTDVPALAAGFLREDLINGENSRPIFRRLTRHAGVALDLSQRHRFEHAEARAGDSAERLSAPVLDQDAHTHAEFQCDLVSGHAHARHVSSSWLRPEFR